MTNILSDFEHVFFSAPCIFLSILCAGLCIPGQSSYNSIFMNEGLEFRVQCMICFILMQKAIILLLCVN